MIDIKEVAKTMTKEEFLEEAKESFMGKLEDTNSCPKNHNLRQFSESECNPFVTCKECWSNAVKDIKFKDDMEVEKVSKKLNIIEAMKMPIGTEFNIVVYGEDDGVVFLRKFDNEDKGNCLYWKSDEDISVCESQVYITDETINATFIPIQQPVSFMEAIEGGLKGNKIKVDATELNKKYDEGIYCALNSYWNNVYFSIAEILKMLSMDNKHLDKIILEGKWYIEESEELEDERLS